MSIITQGMNMLGMKILCPTVTNCTVYSRKQQQRDGQTDEDS
jgi:hypothetical protein